MTTEYNHERGGVGVEKSKKPMISSPLVFIFYFFALGSLIADDSINLISDESQILEKKIYESTSPFTSLKNFDDDSQIINDMDVWERIRSGFSIPKVRGKTVVRYENWFLNNPEYLDKVLTRCKLYLFYVVEQVDKRKMPMDLALLPIIESGYSPYAYSRAHAAGIWQFIPSTGLKFNIKQNWWVDERRDVIVSTNAALDYLSLLHAEFKDWKLALAAYNCGENCVRRAIKRNKKLGKSIAYENLRLPKETRRYLPKLQAIKNIVLNLHKDKYQFARVENKPYFKKVYIDQEMDVVKATEYSNMTIEDFLMLNASYNRPVLIAEKHRPLLIPLDRLDNFNAKNLNEKTNKLNWHLHTVGKTQSVKNISEAFGISSEKLLKLNGIYPTSSLAKGTLVLVPKKKSETPSNISVKWSHPNLIESSNFMRARIFHKIRRGDTLSNIARRYRVTVKALKRWNGLRGNVIQKGKKLVVYGTPSFHRVVAGDTLSGISRRYGVSIKKIKSWNRIRGNLIKIGQKLILYKRSKTPLLKDLLTLGIDLKKNVIWS